MKPKRRSTKRRPQPATDAIRVRGARVHNLKSVDVDIPRDAITVITGVSGSGKSSLAFDTLFAEGQRQYIDSLSAYARQFLDQIPRPDVDSIDGLAPTLAIDQKPGSTSARSTVATVTEIYDYLRLLYARIGTPHCVVCGSTISPQSVDVIRDTLAALPVGTKLMLLSPMIRGRRGAHREVFNSIRKAGLIRARVDGEIYPLEEVPELAPRKNHTIEAVVDRLVIREGIETRIRDSLELGLRLGGGLVTSLIQQDDGGWRSRLYSTSLACPECGTSFEELEPRTFSFNSPYGACPTCEGLGEVVEERPRRTTKRGGKKAKRPDTVDTQRRYCPDCSGGRLRPEALAVTVGGVSIDRLIAMPLDKSAEWMSRLGSQLGAMQQPVARPICTEVIKRLQFLMRVGVGYMKLDRPADSLSGGELQRVRLATSIGSGLVGVCYVLDEPSIGLHPADHDRLLDSIRELKQQGNTIVIVEHDEATMRAADWLIDIGPGAGAGGGEILSQGTPRQVEDDPRSTTGPYLRGERAVPLPAQRRETSAVPWLTLENVATHNLKSITARFPLGRLIGVSGVSGSGKSSLINDTLHPALEAYFKQHAFGDGSKDADVTLVRGLELREAAAAFLVGAEADRPARTGRQSATVTLKGAQHLDKLIRIDQAPIGRSPRSCPATYTGVLDPIRQVYASTREAKTRGFGPNRFSFNSPAGRCQQCGGLGQERIEMNFLSDLFVTCTRCGGKRFNRQTLQVRFKGHSIADVLTMSIDEAADFFANVPKVTRILHSLQAVGLGYLQLGQSSTTLSGGEAQRIKLGTELARAATGQTLYLLDEPTTGLHFQDVERLVGVLQRLVDHGNTVIVIEHQFDLLAACDWLIDLGPEGGDRGGQILAAGPPEEIAALRGNATGNYLKQVLTRR